MRRFQHVARHPSNATQMELQDEEQEDSMLAGVTEEETKVVDLTGVEDSADAMSENQDNKVAMSPPDATEEEEDAIGRMRTGSGGLSKPCDHSTKSSESCCANDVKMVRQDLLCEEEMQKLPAVEIHLCGGSTRLVGLEPSGDRGIGVQNTDHERPSGCEEAQRRWEGVSAVKKIENLEGNECFGEA